MHELSIITYAVNKVEEVAAANGVEQVSSVTLEFGEVSGIVPEYLMNFWEWYKKKVPLVENAQLLYEIIPAITWCDNCKSEYPTVKYGKTCPNCGSGSTWLKQGNELNIKQIEVI